MALYDAALKKVKEEDAAHPPDAEKEYDYAKQEREPYKSEAQLKAAIQEWESHHNQLRELHFFWWAGCLSVVVGAFAYCRIHQWLGLSFCILGMLEMIWATCPSFSSFGYPVEFEHLLLWKIIYSVATLAFVLLAWFGEMRHSQARPASAN